MVPCSLFAPDVNDDLRAASRAELRNAGDVVVALLMVAAITRPAALTVMATITWPSLVGSLYSGCGRLIGYTRNDAIRMINGVNHGTYILRDGHNSVTFVK